MRNYIKADLLRIAKRIPQILVTLLSYGALALAIFIFVQTTRVMADPALAELGLNVIVSSSLVFDAAMKVIPYFAVFMGLLAMIFVFSDDFKAKTAQIAIGAGISRSRIIFSKLTEVLILLVIHALAFAGITILMNALMGFNMNGAQYAELARFLGMNMVLTNMAYLSLVTILLYATQSMVLPILAYLALSFELVSGAIGMLSYIRVLEPLNLGRYTLTTFLGQLETNLGAGVFDALPVIGILAYMAAGIVLATLLFRKKELEF